MSLYEQFWLSYYLTAYVTGAVVYLVVRLGDGAGVSVLLELLAWPIVGLVRLAKRLRPDDDSYRDTP